jgi:4-alpha-glucanotransferase
MKYKRTAGIILHPTSLPGPDGIGDLGPEAFRWVDFLAKSGCSYWQVLPLGPTGYGDSPYQCFSAFAGNPYLVSPAILLDQGLLKRQDLADRPLLPADHVDYGPTINWKLTVLDRAFEHFQRSAATSLSSEFEQFQHEQASWLTDFALFMAIKEFQGGGSWDCWPKPFRSRDEKTLQVFVIENAQTIQRHTFRQFLFFRQWTALRKYAISKGLKIIGDAPIFVAYDSADTWGHPELFYLDKDGLPTVVAGVPPDYFSPTGQLWGNPLYRWDVHVHTGYTWWIERIRAACQLFDIIRLDHFRGFAGYWEVPARMATAEVGRWMLGPGASFFEAMGKALGKLPIIAEDLGEITPDVVTLRDQFNLPGMKILQFAFASDPEDAFLPHNYPVNCVAYTGTHDNDTSLGWYTTAPEKERDFCRRYLARAGNDIIWDMIRTVWGSVAFMALTPMQDLLGLDSSARMNYPGRPSGNWGWRIPSGILSDTLCLRLRETNFLYGRLPEGETFNQKKNF